MSNDLIVDQPTAIGIAYLAIPYGTPGGGLQGEYFSGVSTYADVQIGFGSTTLTKFQLITDVEVEQPLGVVRWGYIDVFGASSYFIEKGRLTLRTQSITVDYPELPVGKQLVVRCRWFFPNINYTAVFNK
ncbi:MAG: hypothetical protein EKK48_31035 [Candidatus Melainabacteria bacterium]|nr:MAG: hypothetical protein EKK48_31035 [Candidatus Melainabacteria bacterium]